MKKNILANAGSLGTVTLGLLAAALVGCGSDASGTSTSATTANPGSRQDAITLQSLTSNGCSATATFDIQSAAAINFIAIDKSDLASANLQLSNVEDSGRITQLDQTAQTADSSMQAMLNASTDNVNAAQKYSMQQAQQAAQTNSAMTANDVESATTTTATSGSSTATDDLGVTHSDGHQDSHSAQASASSTASNDAYNTANAAQSANNVSASALKSKSSLVVGFDPFTEQSARSSSFAFVAAAANADSASASGAKSAANQDSASNSADSTANQTADETKKSTTQTNQNVTTVSSNKNSHTDSSAQNGASNSASASAADNSLNQASTAQNSDQSANSHSSSSTLVFHDLQTLQSHHMLLTVQMTATQAQQLIRIFQGDVSQSSSSSSVNDVTAQADFPISTPACIGTTPISTPVITTPVVSNN